MTSFSKKTVGSRSGALQPVKRQTIAGGVLWRPWHIQTVLMTNENDLDTTIDESATKSPEYRLWLTVTLDAVNDLLDWHSSLAEIFIFDPDNQFFDFVAYELGYEPEKLRERIRSTLGKEEKLLCQRISR